MAIPERFLSMPGEVTQEEVIPKLPVVLVLDRTGRVGEAEVSSSYESPWEGVTRVGELLAQKGVTLESVDGLDLTSQRDCVTLAKLLGIPYGLVFLGKEYNETLKNITVITFRAVIYPSGTIEVDQMPASEAGKAIHSQRFLSLA